MATNVSPVNKRVRIRPRLSRQQLRQFRNVGRNAPGFVAGEQIGSRAPAGIVLEIDECQRLRVAVAHDEAWLSLFDCPGRREAAGAGRS
jgi:hypothetical protein